MKSWSLFIAVQKRLGSSVEISVFLATTYLGKRHLYLLVLMCLCPFAALLDVLKFPELAAVFRTV